LALGDEESAGLNLAALLARPAVGEEATRIRHGLKAARKFLRPLDLDLSSLAKRAGGVELDVAKVRAWVGGSK
jgi:hypothetical protein